MDAGRDQRQQIVENLHESERPLKEAQAVGRIGDWEFDVATQRITWSDQAYALFERDPKLGPPTYEELLGYFLPADSVRFQKLVEHAIQTGHEFETDLRLKLPSGKDCYMLSVGIPVKDSRGKVTKLRGIGQDITGRKLTEESLRLQSAALEAAANAIVITDRNGTILWVNSAFTTLTGYAVDEVVGQNPRILKSGQHDAAFYRDLHDTIQAGRVWQGEVINRRKDGSLYTEEMTITPVRNDKGEISRFIAIKQDITRRKQAEESLRELQRQQRALLDNIPDIAWVKDKESRYVAVNEALSKAYGRSPEEIIGKTDFDMVPPELAEGYRADDKHVMESRQRKRLEEPFEDATGHRIWIDTIKTPITNDKGEVIGTAGIARDFTARKNMEKALRASEERYRSLFETMREGFALCEIICDDAGQPCDFRYLEVNPAFEEIIGIKRSETTHKTAREIFPQIEDYWIDTYGKVALTGVAAHFENYLQALNKHFAVAAFSPKPGQFAAIFVDITEEKRAALALQTSEAQYRALIETTGTGYVIVDREGKVLDANAEYVRLTGHRDLDEIRGRSVIEWTADHEKEKNAEAVRTCFERGYVRNLEIDYVDSRGNVNPVEINATVVERGGTTQILALCRDITDRKKTEETLRTSETKFRRLLESNIVGVVFWNLQGDVLDANDLFLNMVGFTREDLRQGNLRWQNITPPEYGQIDEKAISELATTGTCIPFEKEYIRKDGRRVSVLIGSALLEGQKETGSSFVMDITERKRTDEMLRETNRRLENALAELKSAEQQVIQQERLRALGTMASGVAHDFNNALTAVLGFSDLLLQHPHFLDDKEKTRHYLQLMNTAAQDAGSVVNRLREFYRHREENEVFAPVELNKLVNETISLTQPKWKAQAEASGISIDVRTELQTVLAVAGNATELREALTNLILNAVDAMPRGGTITVRTRQDDGHDMLEVADTGTGMTEEVRRRCLEPFFSTKGEHGTGLGLSMVYGIVQRHEGTINVQSEVGKGTTFTIRLPHCAAKSQPPERHKQVTDIAHLLHVLVVDDEPIVRKVIGKYLEADGHTVQTAADGHDGLEKFRAGRFDLVLLDRAMPGMSGDQVATAIKSASPNMPVIMLTGFGAMMDAADERPTGVDFVVGKPVTIKTLRAALTKVIASAN